MVWVHGVMVVMQRRRGLYHVATINLMMRRIEILITHTTHHCHFHIMELITITTFVGDGPQIIEECNSFRIWQSC